MDIKINTQLIQLSPVQEQMVQKKINHLAHLACRLEDESSEARVDLIYTKSRQPARAYRCHVTFFVPGSVLRAEAYGATLENALDETIDKLKTQIERYKAKTHGEKKRRK